MSGIDFAQTWTVRDTAWHSLKIRRGAYWQRPDLGSDLHLLRNQKSTPTTLARAEAMAQKALAWMVSQGMLLSTSSSAAFDGPRRLRLRVTLIGLDRKPIDLQTFIPVGVVP